MSILNRRRKIRGKWAQRSKAEKAARNPSAPSAPPEGPTPEEIAAAQAVLAQARAAGVKLPE